MRELGCITSFGIESDSPLGLASADREELHLDVHREGVVHVDVHMQDVRNAGGDVTSGSAAHHYIVAGRLCFRIAVGQRLRLHFLWKNRYFAAGRLHFRIAASQRLSLCCLLMPLENKERFMKAKGVEFMIITLKQKKLAYGSAIRALDFAMTSYPPACERFVDVLGLKTAFAASMGKIPISKKNKKERYQEELEERIVSPIASLFGGILRGSRRERLLSKFVENECEKIDRLMELYIRYSDRVKAETERLDQVELDDLEMDEDEKYNRKLESGLYTLQLIAVILGHVWCSEHPQMRGRIELLLKQNKLSKKHVKDILQEYHDNIGDLDGPEEKERAQTKIQKFIMAL